MAKVMKKAMKAKAMKTASVSKARKMAKARAMKKASKAKAMKMAKARAMKKPSGAMAKKMAQAKAFWKKSGKEGDQWQWGFCGSNWYIGPEGRWWRRLDGNNWIRVEH